ncbi:MAG: hypothetical protein IKR84_07310, partial [Oscillibacter sp.]|nr:hypothetical protein [Oscillibacter sp.]
MSFLIVVALMVVTGIVSSVMLSRVGNTLENFHDTSYQTVVNSWKGKRALGALRANLLQTTLESDPVLSANYISEARAEFQTFQEAINALEHTYTGDKANLTRLDTLVQQAPPKINN